MAMGGPRSLAHRKRRANEYGHGDDGNHDGDTPHGIILRLRIGTRGQVHELCPNVSGVRFLAIMTITRTPPRKLPMLLAST